MYFTADRIRRMNIPTRKRGTAETGMGDHRPCEVMP